MRTKIIISLGVVFVALGIWFQNCAGANYHGASDNAGTLGAGGVDPNGNPVDPNNPGSTPTATPTPSASSTPSGNNTDELCIVTNPNDHGENFTIEIAVLYKFTDHMQAVCMSANACLNIINNYLNTTLGIFGGTCGNAPPTPVQYTKQKINSVCQTNPNVIHMTDDQVTAALAALQLPKPH